MKVRVDLEVAGRAVHETVEGTDATDLLAKAKARVAKELGWKGMFLNAMSPLAFAQLAVNLYNEKFKTEYPTPKTAEEFFEFGAKTGTLTVLEP